MTMMNSPGDGVRWQTIEMVARRMCIQFGHDPDEQLGYGSDTRSRWSLYIDSAMDEVDAADKRFKELSLRMFE